MNNYTSTEWILIIGAVGGTVATIAGAVSLAVVNIMGARMKQAVKAEVVQTILPVMTETLTTAKVIAGHVNSEKSISEGEIKTLHVEVEMLREQLAEKTQIAAILAAKVPVPIQVINGPVLKSVSATGPADTKVEPIP